jgi:ArsR family transcriptional regulator
MSIDVVTFAKTMADETRHEIITLLCCQWLSVNDVVEGLHGKVNQPTVSHHLKKLEEADLVVVRQEGRQRFYTLNQEEWTLCCNLLYRAGDPTQAKNLIAVSDIQ